MRQGQSVCVLSSVACWGPPLHSLLLACNAISRSSEQHSSFELGTHNIPACASCFMLLYSRLTFNQNPQLKFPSSTTAQFTLFYPDLAEWRTGFSWEAEKKREQLTMFCWPWYFLATWPAHSAGNLWSGAKSLRCFPLSYNTISLRKITCLDRLAWLQWECQ